MDENDRKLETGFIFSNDDYRSFPILYDVGDDRVATTLIIVNGNF